MIILFDVDSPTLSRLNICSIPWFRFESACERVQQELEEQHHPAKVRMGAGKGSNGWEAPHVLVLERGGWCTMGA